MIFECKQQTELQLTQMMTDTGAYSDVVFGLFRLLGYRFSPRLADIGGTRFDPALMTARLANAVKDPLTSYECETTRA